MNLKTKSLALVAVCFVLTLGFSYGLLQLLGTEIRDGLASMYAREQVNFNRARVLQPLLRELALAQKLADSAVIRAWAKNEADPQLRRDALRELEGFRRFFADRSYFFALRDSGHYYYNDRDNRYQGEELRYTLDPDAEEDRWFFRILDNNADYELNVDYDEKLQVTKVWINLVVRDAGQQVGVIGTGIDLSEFIQGVVSSNADGVTSLFIEQGGAIQAHNQKNLIDFRTQSKTEEQRKTIYQLMDDAEDVERLRAAMARQAVGEQVETLTARIDGRPVLLGVGAIPEIGWYNITLLDTASIIGPRHIVPFAALLFFALLALALALSAVLNRYVIRRVFNLDKLVCEFAKGGEIAFPDDENHDEIGRLEHSLQQMAVGLRQHSQLLEQKVADRTRELAEKNEALNKALSDLKVLRGLLPICMYCKEIRDDQGAWTRLETYIAAHSEAQFSHGICDKCMADKHPQQHERLQRRAAQPQED